MVVAVNVLEAMNGSRYFKPSTGSDTKDGICRIVVLGNPGVGKTESIYRYSSTSADDDDIRLDILDTAGQIPSEWKDSYALWGDCFIFVYSITEYTSFEEIHRLRKLVESTRRSTSLCCVVVGNKNDLVYDRQVTVRQGQELAADFSCKFYEVSACDWNHLGLLHDLFTNLHYSWKAARLSREGRQRKSSSSAKFKQAIQKVISGKTSTSKRASLTSYQNSSNISKCRFDE